MNYNEKSSLEQAANTAHSIYGALKTGKAIAAAAKGAVVGGPCGAVAGLALEVGQNGQKLLAAVLALLMLPVLVVLMLPGLIFGDLSSSGALALNDDTAISSQMSAVVSAIDTVLLEGIAGSGHFIVLRGVQDGKILVADPASTSKSQKAWDLSIILNEAGHRAGVGGPFWLIG